MIRADRWIWLGILFLAGACSGGKGRKEEADMRGSKPVAFTVIPPDVFEGVEIDPAAYGTPPAPTHQPILFWLRSEVALGKIGFKVPPSPNRAPDMRVSDVLYIYLVLQGTTGDQAGVEKIEQKENMVRVQVRHVYATGGQGEAMTPVTCLVAVPKLPPDTRLELVVNGNPTPFILKTPE